MVRKEFLSHLKDHQLVQATELESLRSLTLEYPYFQSAKALYLKSLKAAGKIEYNGQLKKTAAQTVDRTVLFDFITKIVENHPEAKQQTEVIVEEKQSEAITESDISKLDFIEFVPSQETEKITENWLEYIQLQEQVSLIKKGDFSYFIDNKEAIDELFKSIVETIPEELNNSSILARIKTVETKLYKLGSFTNLETTSKKELLSTIKEFLISISNLDLQMNKTIELENQNIEKP